MRNPQSLRSSRDFRRLYAAGSRARRNGVTVYVVPRSDRDLPTRVGLAVRADRRSAVERNRVRRRLRAAFRSGGPARGWDVVLRASEDAGALSFQELEGHLVRALGEAGVEVGR